MDKFFELNSTTFVWDDEKARKNEVSHSGVTFEHAAHVFFDPFLRILDASRNLERRDAVIGFDTKSRLLFVVHIQVDTEYIRIISARKATTQERNEYDS